jgi:hypothetical protein
MSRFLALGAVLCLATAPAAFGGARSLERAMETMTDLVVLPGRQPGSLHARACAQCPSVSMQVPQTARFYVGEDDVTFTQLREFVRGKRENMTLFYDLKVNVVTRIVVFGELPKPRAD